MASSRLFPLTLTPFEQFLLMVDERAYPSIMLIAYEFSGEVLREHFEAALEQALQRHPLLTSVVRPGKRDLPCFKPAPNCQPWIDWGEGDEPLRLPGDEWIDLSSEVGLRIWVRNRGDRSSITFQFHHCCTDGIGAHRFIGDLLTLYAQRMTTGEESPTLELIEPERLRGRRRRCYFGLEQEGSEAAAPSGNAEVQPTRLAREGMSYLFRFLVRGVASLAHPRPKPLDASSAMPFPHLHQIVLDKDECKRLRKAGVANGVSGNDLLVAALLATIARWNREMTKSRRNARIQLLVPTDLRDRGDERAPAGNFVGWLHITRKASECGASLKLARSVYLEIGRARYNQVGTEFTRALTGAFYVPGLVGAILRWRANSFPTAVLTNVGDVSRRLTAAFPRKKGRIVAGNLTLERVFGAAPIDDKTRLSVAVVSYNRTMSIAVRADPRWYDGEDHRHLLAMFKEILEELLATLEADELTPPVPNN